MSEEQNQHFQDGDDSLSINLSAVKEQSFEAIPKGVYPVVVEACEYSRSKSTNQPMWSMTLTIVDGDFKGRKIFHNMSFSEKALPMTKSALGRIAPEVITDNFNPKRVADEGLLIGKAFSVKTKLEEYDGEKRTRVAEFVKPRGDNDGFIAA